MKFDVGETNREKTYCANGHDFNEENTYYYTGKDGYFRRQCLPCKKKTSRESKRRTRARQRRQALSN